MDFMFVLAMLIMVCFGLALIELLVWIWDKLDPPAEIKEVHFDDYRNRKVS